MGQYYWKDDSIVTSKQRAKEIKNVISSGGYEMMPLRNKKAEGTKSVLL